MTSRRTLPPNPRLAAKARQILTSPKLTHEQKVAWVRAMLRAIPEPSTYVIPDSAIDGLPVRAAVLAICADEDAARVSRGDKALARKGRAP